MHHLGRSENKRSLPGKARWTQPSEEGGSSDHEKDSADDEVQSPQPKRRRVLHKKVVAVAEGGSSELQLRDGALRGVSKKSGRDSLLLKKCIDNPNKKSGKKQKEITVEVRISNTGEPIGEFWKAMRHYAYSYAPRYFPWHLKWSEQDKRLKSSFVRKLESKFGGGWNDTTVMKAISKLMRRKRLWARSLITEDGGKAEKPVACTLVSWDSLIAQEALKHEDATFLRAKNALKARLEKKAFHHLGTRGVKGTYTKFVSTVTYLCNWIFSCEKMWGLVSGRFCASAYCCDASQGMHVVSDGL
jgi:hypothetical protein